MRRIAFAAALLIVGFAGSASAQRVSSNTLVYGQPRSMPQDFSSLTAMQGTQGAGTAADRAARAARQAQFNHNFPGTPISGTSAR
jgi:hypothetical protein